MTQSPPLVPMPGPWSASEMTMNKKLWAGLNSGSLHIVQANWDGWAGDVVACVWADDDHDEAATARLIAAAPDLFEALGAMMKSFDDRQLNPRFKPHPAVAMAEAALSKATGHE